MQKTIQYFREVRAEMAYVNWPTRRQTIYFTIAVLLISGFIAYFLGFFDKIFSMGLDRLINR